MSAYPQQPHPADPTQWARAAPELNSPYYMYSEASSQPRYSMYDGHQHLPTGAPEAAATREADLELLRARAAAHAAALSSPEAADQDELSSIPPNGHEPALFKPIADGASGAGGVPRGRDAKNMSIIFPRRKAKAGAGEKQGPVVITLEFLASFAHMPLGAAAKILGISATALKKACRKLGNNRWPVVPDARPSPSAHPTQQSNLQQEQAYFGAGGPMRRSYSPVQSPPLSAALDGARTRDPHAA